MGGKSKAEGGRSEGSRCEKPEGTGGRERAGQPLNGGIERLAKDIHTRSLVRNIHAQSGEGTSFTYGSEREGCPLQKEAASRIQCPRGFAVDTPGNLHGSGTDIEGGSVEQRIISKGEGKRFQDRPRRTAGNQRGKKGARTARNDARKCAEGDTPRCRGSALELDAKPGGVANQKRTHAQCAHAVAFTHTCQKERAARKHGTGMVVDVAGDADVPGAEIQGRAA